MAWARQVSKPTASLFSQRLQVLLLFLLSGLSYWVHAWPCLCIVSLLQSRQSISSILHPSHSLLPYSVRLFTSVVSLEESVSLLDSSLLLSFSSGVLSFTSSWLVFLDPVLIFFLHSSALGRPLCIHQSFKKQKHFATSQLFCHLRFLSGLEESRCCGVATRLSPLFLCLFLYSVKCWHGCVLQMFPLLSSLGFILCEF